MLVSPSNDHSKISIAVHIRPTTKHDVCEHLNVPLHPSMLSHRVLINQVCYLYSTIDLNVGDPWLILLTPQLNSIVLPQQSALVYQSKMPTTEIATLALVPGSEIGRTACSDSRCKTCNDFLTTARRPKQSGRRGFERCRRYVVQDGRTTAASLWHGHREPDYTADVHR